MMLQPMIPCATLSKSVKKEVVDLDLLLYVIKGKKQVDLSFQFYRISLKQQARGCEIDLAVAATILSVAPLEA